MSVSLALSLPPTLDAALMMYRGFSLEKALFEATRNENPETKAAVQSMLYTYTRQRFLCEALIEHLASRKPSNVVFLALAVALSEMLAHPEKDYVIVNETIALMKNYRDLAQAAGFVNACLRRFGREKNSLLASCQESEEVRYNAPHWYIEKLRSSIGSEETEGYFSLVKRHPPLILRANRRQITPQAWCETVKNQGINAKPLWNDAILVDPPVPVTKLPGFEAGDVSVQDAGAQLAALFLAPKANESILDACAAPGGKTAHLLEISDASVTALEIDPLRAEKITENLKRLHLEASVRVADAADKKALNTNERFDSILLDAPCTASGIARRHPDVITLRRPEDIDTLAKQQKRLLEALWPHLKFGGKLLYVVCSVFKEEGEWQIRDFLSRHHDAKALELFKGLPSMLSLPPCERTDTMYGVVPPIHDGFFYALLTKK